MAITTMDGSRPREDLEWKRREADALIEWNETIFLSSNWPLG